MSALWAVAGCAIHGHLNGLRVGTHPNANLVVAWSFVPAEAHGKQKICS